MINGLPPISTVLTRLGVPIGRRGRTCCPIHRGDNPTAFVYDDDKGRWYCFRCGIGGDVISLVMKSLDIDFKAALQWLGVLPGRWTTPEPEYVHWVKIRKGLKAWVRVLAKELNFEHYIKEKVITMALSRLRKNPEDSWAWNWLGWALPGLEAIAYKLDLLSGDESDQIEVFKNMGDEA